MNLLLVTHALVWWIKADPRLSEAARRAILDDDTGVYVSVASAWEIAIKVGSGKWDEARKLLENSESAVADEGFDLLPLAVIHVRTAGLMPVEHRDPFDRLLAAQASIEELTLVTIDPSSPNFGRPCCGEANPGSTHYLQGRRWTSQSPTIFRR